MCKNKIKINKYDVNTNIYINMHQITQNQNVRLFSLLNMQAINEYYKQQFYFKQLPYAVFINCKNKMP